MLSLDPLTQETYLHGILSPLIKLGYGCAWSIFKAENWQAMFRQRQRSMLLQNAFVCYATGLHINAEAHYP